MEIVNGTEITYLYAQGQPFAIHKNIGFDGELYYLHLDNQGSLMAISDNTGNVIENRSYDAWGRPRNPDNWEYDQSNTFCGGGFGITTRGYTMHEHLEMFNLINMNGRLYDPLLGRMLSPDNYIQSPNSTQSYNRYSYCVNNPLKYTDPTGDLLQYAFMGLAFIADYSSNLLNGVNDPAGTAYNNVTNAMNGINNASQVTIYNNGNTSLSIGINPFFISASASLCVTSGNLTSSVSAGIGLSGPFYTSSLTYANGISSVGFGMSNGNNYNAWGLNTKINGFGAGYYKTYYGNKIGPDGKPNKQTVGGVNIYLGDVSLRIENDFLAFDDHDRWRSNAAEISIGNFVIGTNLYNNDPESEGLGIEEGTDRMGNSNTGTKYKAWANGQTYTSPLWFGYRYGNNIDRIGFSHPAFQDRTQNYTHRNGFLGIFPFGHANFFNKYDNFIFAPWLYTGYNNPFSLWW